LPRHPRQSVDGAPEQLVRADCQRDTQERAHDEARQRLPNDYRHDGTATRAERTPISPARN
jgi:hypothetical protein